MATFSSNLIPATDDGKDRITDGSLTSGDALWAIASYTLVGTEAADDIINLINLPEGCRVIPGASFVVAENPGTALVIDIGDDDAAGVDVDRYADGITLSSGGQVAFGAAGVAAQTPYKLQNQSKVQAKVITATSLTGDTALTFFIAYSAKS